MASFNQVILIGNLTKDPEVKTLPKGSTVCGFSLAANRRWKSESGEDKEEVFFASCKAFGKSADSIGKYVKKGDPLMITGRLTTEKWTAKDGQEKSSTRIVVEQFQFLKSRDAGSAAPAAKPAAAVAKPDLDPEDDLPF
ncbi:MAG: single-stranded DNA-binding protein [Actinobacteria bacterium]|jgi:single-strand DNA-binding protein|nr:single-stranded DNA-binding protein [Actinomycetota bacterium]